MILKRLMLLPVVIISLFMGEGLAGEGTAEFLRDLPFSVSRDRMAENILKKGLPPVIPDGDEKKLGDRGRQIEVYRIEAPAEEIGEFLKRRGIALEELDVEKMRKKRLLIVELVDEKRQPDESVKEPRDPPWIPPEIDGFRYFRGRGKDGSLLVLQSHHYDHRKRKWLSGVSRLTVQWIEIPQAEPSSKSPSPRPVPDGTGPRLPGRSR